jgi:hypothetical protein
MPFFQSQHVKISTGNGEGFQSIERIQSATWGFQIPRADISNLGRFKPLNERPVINYTPISYSIDAIKSSREIETNLGLINTTGVGIVLGQTNGTSLTNYGTRNLEFLNGASNSANYDTKVTVYSGCLNSYSMNVSIGEPAKVSFNGEGFDYKVEAFTDAKDNTNFATALVRAQDTFYTGIQFSGAGVTGLNVQSFGLNLSFGRQAIGYFGRKFPDRPITSINASISVNGFLEGFSPLNNLSHFDCGHPLTGSIFVTLIPSCSGAGAGTTYEITNSYIDSVNFGSSVGSFTSVDFGLSLPISVSATEAANGSNLKIT